MLSSVSAAFFCMSFILQMYLHTGEKHSGKGTLSRGETGQRGENSICSSEVT